jgi:hypothetical protein
MQICAFFLAGRDIHREIREGRYPRDDDHGIVFGRDCHGLLTLEMKVRRPKLLSVVVPEDCSLDDNKKSALSAAGVACFPPPADLEDFYAIHNSQMVLLDKKLKEELDENFKKEKGKELNEAQKAQLRQGSTSFRVVKTDFSNVIKSGCDSTEKCFKAINQVYQEYIEKNYKDRLEALGEFAIEFSDNHNQSPHASGKGYTREVIAEKDDSGDWSGNFEIDELKNVLGEDKDKDKTSQLKSILPNGCRITIETKDGENGD